ncbi:MAG: hypothetical protein RL577_503, partial [Bacteroidota bacterium]
MPRAKSILLFLVLFVDSFIQAQGLRIYPLAARWSEPQQSEQSLMWGITDTLTLPF